MATFFTTIRMAVGAISLICVLAIAAPVSAQQRNPDGSVNPTASAVKEEQLLQQLRQVQGRVSIPDKKEGTLILGLRRGAQEASVRGARSELPGRTKRRRFSTDSRER